MPDPAPTHVLTQIAHPGKRLTEEHARAFHGVFYLPHEPVWLKSGHAVDNPFTFQPDINFASVRAQIADSIKDASISWCLQPCDRRRKRLLVADMESTIIEQEMLDEMADAIGARAKVADITARAMRGELGFETALKERVALFEGLDAARLDEFAARITAMPGAATLVATMKANGGYCALVSGGFTVFTERVASDLGFDEQQANVLEIENGKLTGRVTPPILGREAKREALQRLARARGLSLDECLAVGDGANDIAMIKAAGLGVAYRAKPVLESQADCAIRHGDLTALLYLQGYSRDEFCET